MQEQEPPGELATPVALGRALSSPTIARLKTP